MPKDVGDTDTTKAVCSEQSGPKCHYASIGVKLGHMSEAHVLKLSLRT